MTDRLKEILKFAFTGGVCFVIEYAALILLKELLHIPVVAATPIAFLISVVFNYLLCVKWVFDGAQEGSKKAQLGFLITSVMGLIAPLANIRVPKAENRTNRRTGRINPIFFMRRLLFFIMGVLYRKKQKYQRLI